MVHNKYGKFKLKLDETHVLDSLFSVSRTLFLSQGTRPVERSRVMTKGQPLSCRFPLVFFT